MKFSDGVTLEYNRNETTAMLDCFEHWYNIVSRGGRTFTRAKARQQIVDAYKRKIIKDKTMQTLVSAANEGRSIDLTDVDSDDEDGQLIAAIKIRKMNKDACIAECKRIGEDTHGLRDELRERIAKHHNVDLTTADKPKSNPKDGPKHKAEWKKKRVPVTPIPFTRVDFNMESLTRAVYSTRRGTLRSHL